MVAGLKQSPSSEEAAIAADANTPETADKTDNGPLLTEVSKLIIGARIGVVLFF